MNKKKLKIFLLIFSLSEFFYGCCGNNGYIKKEAIVEREIPPAIFWNNSDKILKVFVIRGDGSGIISFFVEPNDFRRQPFSQEGSYRYYIKTYRYIKETGKSLFVGEIHGAFKIFSGKIKTYNDEQAGIHIIIQDKNIRYRKEALIDIFGDKNFIGIAKHKKYSEEIVLRNRGSEANIKMQGIFSLIPKLLQNENK